MKRRRRIERGTVRRKKRIADHRARVGRRLYIFYLIQILLLGVLLLSCGLYYAGSGSERLWHGEQSQRVYFSDVKKAIEEKWDLFLRTAGDTIFR